jgi:hypothetical protein
MSAFIYLFESHCSQRIAIADVLEYSTVFFTSLTSYLFSQIWRIQSRVGSRHCS